MLNFSPLALGTILITLGAAFLLLILLILRVVPRIKPRILSPGQYQSSQSKTIPSIQLDIQTHNNAILLVQPGGRIVYSNQHAREWFSLAPEEEFNLERMSRRTHPDDRFIGLCAQEGQARFSVEGQFVEGHSYYLPYDGSGAILVSLQPAQVNGDNSQKPDSYTSEATIGPSLTAAQLELINGFIRTSTASFDLETTIKNILETFERLVQNDAVKLWLWHAKEGPFTVYQLPGVPGTDRILEKKHDRNIPGEAFSQYICTQRKSLLIADAEAEENRLPSDHIYPYRSFLGVPLSLENNLIGTLEATSFQARAYEQRDLEITEIFAGPSTFALQNVLHHQNEQHYVKALDDLAHLARRVSKPGDEQGIFASLVDHLSQLVDAKVLGFLIYDNVRRTLIGQVPFHGFPPDFIDLYQAEIPAGSQAEEIWLKPEIIISDHPAEDARLQALGLDHTARASGMEHTILLPLISSGRNLGYLQVADKYDGTPFAQNDLQLLEVISGQVAPIIENFGLYKQSNRQAARDETLRRISQLTNTLAPVDDLLKAALLELVNLVQANIAIVFLLDDTKNELNIHTGSIYAISSKVSDHLNHLSISGPQYSQIVTNNQQAFITGKASQECPEHPLYRPFIKELHMESLLDVPLVFQEQSYGEILLGNQSLDFFEYHDAITVATAARQIAGAIERSVLALQTDESLRQRIEQLNALGRIGRELNTSLDYRFLLQRVYDEAIHTTQADCGRILLFELGNQQVTSRRILLKVSGCTSKVTSSETTEDFLPPLERAVLQTGEPLVVYDYQTGLIDASEKVRHLIEYEAFSSRYRAHAELRSALIVPIMYQGNNAGLIHLHAMTPDRFGQAALEVTQMLAVQAAIALGNAQLYQDQKHQGVLLNRRVEIMEKFQEAMQLLSAGQPLNQSLEIIARGIRDTTPFQVILISIYNVQTGNLERVAGAGLTPETLDLLKEETQSWSAVQRLSQAEFKIGCAYFISYEKMPVKPPDVHIYTPLSLDNQPLQNNAWHPEDLLFVPLTATSGRPLGLISVDSPQDGLRPDHASIDSLGIFASQATLIIDIHKNLQDLHSKLGQIKQEADRAQEAAQAANRQLPILLRKDLEQATVIRQLNQRVDRIRASLEIAGMINQEASHADVLRVYAQALQEKMGFDIVLVAITAPDGPQIMHTVGELPAGVNPEALFGQRNPLRQSLQEEESILVADLTDNKEWQKIPLLRTLRAGAFISQPITSDGKLYAAILSISRTSLVEFTSEDEQLFALLARQVGYLLQNLDRLEQIRQHDREVNLLLEFTRRIGSLEPTHILQSLVDSARQVVQAADAGMVALWDTEMNCLVPQAAAGYADIKRLLEVTFKPGKTPTSQAYERQQPVRIDEIDIAQHYDLPVEDLLRYRDATGGRLPVSCLNVPIVTTQYPSVNADTSPENTRALGVLVLENFKRSAAFTLEDQALIGSLTQQTALILENVRLYQAAAQRASQLQALTKVAGAISSSLQRDELINSLLDQLQTVLRFDTGTLWMKESDQLTVQAVRGFEDAEERIGLSVAIQDSLLFKEMISTHSPISVVNVRSDQRFSPLMEYPRLSWLGIPLVTKREVIGLIALEKTEADFYTREAVQLATTFASQAAVALENADLYADSLRRSRELDQRSQRLALLNRLSTNLGSTLDLDNILNLTIQELLQAMSSPPDMDFVEVTQTGKANIAITALLGTDPSEFARSVQVVAEIPRLSNQLPKILPYVPLFDRLSQTMGVFATEDILGENDLAPLRDYMALRKTHSLLMLPMATGETMHGFLLVHVDRLYRFTSSEIELGRTIGNQAAIAIENARLYAETSHLTETLEKRVEERTYQLALEHQRTSTLLRIITELSASLDLDLVLNRTLIVLNEVVDAEQITCLVLRTGESKLRLVASIGYTNPPPPEGRPSPFGPNQGLAGWVISNRKPVLIGDVRQDIRWIPSADVQTQHRSAIGVPLLVGDDLLGTLLLFHRQPDHFSHDQLDLVQAAANQVAVTINNAELYNLIRDQAEDLGTMLRNQQIETSRSRAILEAIAEGVLVTDASSKITLFNASAENILNLKRSQVLGQSLEHFIGLFGKAARTWMDTVRTWSSDPVLYNPNDTYSEQIKLENGSIVSVHLAPVLFRSEFLGTVSIFHDITHQVEVDRLKSEFVATVSHELRTPMTSIKGYVDVLLMGAAGKLTDQQVHFLEIVKNNTERLTILVNDLLDISQIESGRTTLSLQPVDIRSLGEDTVKEFQRRSQHEKKQMVFSFEVGDPLPMVLGDPLRIREILINLFTNAYQYTPEKGQITLRMYQNGKDIQVEVQDTGIGIHPEDHTRVFERFFRGENPSVLEIPGTGLGLSIVQYLVRMHQGSIWLESSGIPGEGTSFYFTLPVYDAENAPSKVELINA